MPTQAEASDTRIRLWQVYEIRCDYCRGTIGREHNLRDAKALLAKHRATHVG